jgi:PadR family transcriptional regulator PadR
MMAEDSQEENEEALANVRRELSRGTSELAVLALLLGGERYGYEILKRLESMGGTAIEIKEGTLYPLLHRLENDGHIVGEWKTNARERPRKYYGLTPRGEMRLGLLRSEWEALLEGVQTLLDTLDEEDA